MAWRPARCLDVLLAEVNLAAPFRDKSNDGTLGDTAHAGRTSDHNPDSQGVVHALDITHDPRNGCDSYVLAEALLASKDVRIKYVISNRKIASGTGQSNPAWVWRPYSGSNPHDQHVHVSIKAEPALADSILPWSIGEMSSNPGLPPLVVRPKLAYGSTGEAVRVLQQAVMVDGYFGPLTEASVKSFQKAHGLVQDGIVGPYTWAALLPPDPVTETASPDKTNWQTGITATVFGGASEVELSAYDGHRVTESEMAVALPDRFTGPRPKVEVSNSTGKTVTATIEDVGPWYTNDPYWEMGSRPKAESGLITSGPNKGRTSNKAGIDLSPALARSLGVDGKGLVDWKFVVPAAATPLTRSVEMPITTAPITTVEVQSAWASKINWTQVVGIAATGASVFTAGKFNAPVELQVALVTAIQSLVAVTTIIMKTWFSGTVTPGSVT